MDCEFKDDYTICETGFLFEFVTSQFHFHDVRKCLTNKESVVDTMR